MSENAFLTEAERQQVLVAWNDTQAEFPRELCIHHLFEAQAVRTPDRVAVRGGGQQLTFRELDRRANRMARFLQACGVGPDVLVGVSMERSPEMVVGLLGVLKAGGAYVPLDPAYPKERLAFLLEDTGIGLLLTQARLVERLPAHRARVICLDAQWAEIAAWSEEAPESGVTPENVCYVVYTSGSTGTPKGVMGLHRGAVNRFAWMWKAYPFCEEEVGCQKTSLNFVDSVWEIWGHLLQGVPLVLIPDAVVKDVPQLVQVLQAERVSRLVLVPSLLRVMLDTHPDLQDRLPALRLWVCSGEALPVDLVRRFQAAMPGAKLLNLYGMSEAAADSTYFDTSLHTGEWTSVPIGRPIANTQVFLLDEQMQPVPVGATGEIYIGGAGLARGYWNRPDLTAERFLPHPFGCEGERLYRTGDVARYRADGVIEYLGRIDDQVKIRGFRIELQEVEAALREFPGLRQVLVSAREDVPGERRLVAYVVAEKTAKVQSSFSELHTFLKSKLPEYMVPSAIVFLDDMPLTPNGKVDKRALPAPDDHRSGLEANYVPPRTRTEEVLAGIWADVFGLAQVGVYDLFFELGGQSLLAAQIVARARDALQVELPVSVLFEAPTVAALAEWVQAHRQETMHREPAPMRARNAGRADRLSSAQRRMWFLHRLAPESALYNVAYIVRMQDSLDVAALEFCLTEIIARHEVLRTTFEEENGQPVPVVAESLPLSLPVTELGDRPVAERVALAAHLAAEEAQKPFDLQKGPLLRVHAVRLGEQEHHLLVTMHHIVTDGWSFGVFVQELAAIYEAFEKGEPAPLPALPWQYAEYAEWHHRFLQDGVLEAQLAYWKKQLAGDVPLLQLPTDRPEQATPSVRGASTHWEVPERVLENIRSLSRQEGATPYMILLAAFQALLYRYTGEQDIWVGTPIAGRNRSRVEGLIGCFVNTLVVRTQVQGGASFRDLLRQVREVSLAAFAHQDVPFEKLVEALQPDRESSRSPLFQVMFAYEHAAMQAAELPHLTMRAEEVHNGTAPFDLTLSFVETEQGVRASFAYSTDLFDEATITRMRGHFETLLTGVLAEPDRRLAVAPLLTKQEQRQMLVEWNDTVDTYPRDATMADLFEEQVARTPERVAVVFAHRCLTYRELNERANRLAHVLQKRGVGAETLVGFALERSLETIVTLVAIIKTGGAYVAFDVKYPSERLAMMIADTQTPVIVSKRQEAALLPAHQADVVLLDADEAELAEESAENPVRNGTADNLAYVIYTSGSTGVPKGVAMPQRGVVRLVKGQRYVPNPQEETFLHIAPISFDAAVFEIWAPLLNGGRLVVMPVDQPSLAELGRTIREQGVTTFLVTSGLMVQLVNSQLDDLHGLHFMLAGGDALSAPHVQRVVREVPGLRFFNVYGPTEGSTFSTVYEVMDTGRIANAVPIGRPLANTDAYVLDAAMQPVPVGVDGELYVGGDGLARGYWRRPELTAERFVPHPFRDDPQARLYKTGDRVRYAADGQLEFIGRMDNQIKLRGFRIELGEIEAVLGQHPDVQEFAVTVREFTPGDKRLVAYVVPKLGIRTTVGEFRQFLRAKLPEYLVPAAVVLLDELVLTRNGKVDRRALPTPEWGHEETSGGFVAPRTTLEERLAGVWQEVLGVAEVGVHDHFFELGGHSMLGMQVMARLREELQVDVPLRSLFAAPTVAGLAEVVEALVPIEHEGVQGAGEQGEAQRSSSANGAVSAIPVAPRDGELVLSSAQQRLWFLDRLEPGSPVYNMTFAVRLQGELVVAALERALNEIVRRHEALRTTFVEAEGQPRQVVQPKLVIRLAPVEASETEAMEAVQEEAGRGFDLARGPLLRVQLVRMAADAHLLILNMHHIVTDGWSMGVFMQELAVIYEAFVSGEASPLGALPVQYADFAAWHQRRMTGEVFTEQLAYWKRQLSGSLPVLQLPTDRPVPALLSTRGATHRFRLPKHLLEACAAFSRQEGATVFITLLAVFKTLLYRYTGQEDVLVGAPFANRVRGELEGLIGFFVNTLVLRTDLSGAPSFRELVRRVRDVAMGAHVHQDLPFEKLVEVLQPDRLYSHSPLFQVMFAYENTAMHPRQVAGVAMIPMEVSNRTAKFDLSLSLYEGVDGVEATFEYRTDLFDAGTMERMQGHLETLLAAAMEQPERAIGRLPMLTEAEREQLVRWGHTDAGQMHILDQELQVVPVGVPGELCVRDVEAARRALERPDLQAVEAVPAEGALLYKTGRLARRLPDGSIELLGRLDQQVTIRGYRVDLGEMEAVLQQHPHVREAAVVVWEEVPGRKRLIGYVVPTPGQEVAQAELRAYLQERLPSYKVPSAYLNVASLPKNGEGRLDRAALPVPDLASLEREEAYVAPRTALEEVVAILWAEVLGVETVGMRDNFFAIGGYSLLGIQVIARIREALDCELPVRALFDAPTVEELTAVMLADESERVRLERTAEWLLRMAQMSEAEVEAMLMNRNGG